MTRNLCDFPAKELLRMRRDIAGSPHIKPEYQGVLIMRIDAMRNAHSDKTDCMCWQEAIKESPSPNRWVEVDGRMVAQ